jgi:hypothetical protein
MKKLQPLAAALCLGTLGTFLVDSAIAHHSFQATYNLDETIEIQGTLVQFNFRNPHASVMVDVTDDSGEITRWGIEWGGASLLMRQGLTRDSFKPGDEIIIQGQSAWNPDDNRLRMESILRPLDGFGWGFDEDQVFD